MDKECAGTQPVEACFAQREGLIHSRMPPLLTSLAASVGISVAKAHHDLCPKAPTRGLASLLRLHAVHLAQAGAL